MRVLVLNSGSSSVKYQLVDSDTGERHAAGIVEEVVDHELALREVVAAVERLGEPVEAIGHRVVHGGDVFSEPVRIGAHRWNAGGVYKSMIGDIDEVRIYDRGLSESEIKQLAGPPGKK